MGRERERISRAIARVQRPHRLRLKRINGALYVERRQREAPDGSLALDISIPFLFRHCFLRGIHCPCLIVISTSTEELNRECLSVFLLSAHLCTKRAAIPEGCRLFIEAFPNLERKQAAIIADIVIVRSIYRFL